MGRHRRPGARRARGTEPAAGRTDLLSAVLQGGTMASTMCRWGIMGCANIARKNARCMLLAENASVVAVVSPAICTAPGDTPLLTAGCHPRTHVRRRRARKTRPRNGSRTTACSLAARKPSKGTTLSWLATTSTLSTYRCPPLFTCSGWSKQPRPANTYCVKSPLR